MATPPTNCGSWRTILEAMSKKMFKGMERPTEEKIDAGSYDMYLHELKYCVEARKESFASGRTSPAEGGSERRENYYQ